MWSPYLGSSAIVLAVVLFVVTGALLFMAARLSHPLAARRPGPFLGVLLVVSWLISVLTFAVASTTYVWALLQQMKHITAPQIPITPVTLISAFLAFAAIVTFAERSGFWVAFSSAVVGTIAAPMVFELPFDLIVMGHTHPPTPAPLFTLLYFLPLYLVEISSFALLTLSPLLTLSRTTLVLLASMFFIFALWAIFGFAYPSAPLPIALNTISKILAFATAVSLFLPEGASPAFRRSPGTTTRQQPRCPRCRAWSDSMCAGGCGACVCLKSQSGVHFSHARRLSRQS